MRLKMTLYSFYYSYSKMIRKISAEYHNLDVYRLNQETYFQDIYDELCSVLHTPFDKCDIINILPPTSFIRYYMKEDIILITFHSKCELYIDKSPNPIVENKIIKPDYILDKMSVYLISFPQESIMFTLHTLHKKGGYFILAWNNK